MKSVPASLLSFALLTVASLPAPAVELTEIVVSETDAVEVFADWFAEDTFYDDDWESGYNWSEGVVPANDGTIQAFFGDTPADSFFQTVATSSPVFVDSLHFDYDSNYYFYSKDSHPLNALTTATGIYLYGAEDFSFVYFDSSLYLDVGTVSDTETRTWTVGQGSELEIAATLNGFGTIIKNGAGAVFLGGDSTLGAVDDVPTGFSGQLELREGSLGLYSDNALGAGTLFIGPAAVGETFIIPTDDEVTLPNDVWVSDALNFATDIIDSGPSPAFTFGGTVTLLNHTTLTNAADAVTFAGTLTETAENPGVLLSIETEDAPIIFSGVTAITGGIEVLDGAAVFLDQSALPGSSDGAAFPLLTGSEGYIGILDPDGLSSFLALWNRSDTTGVIGLDTAPSASTPNVFSDNIDLTGFSASARLGSLTRAELSGTITPQGDTYMFGGGGGQLLVSTPLTDDGSLARNVFVGSEPMRPLTVMLNSGANTFSGSLQARYSAVLFGTTSGVPTADYLEPLEGGYIGIQDTAVSVDTFLDQFTPTLEQGIIGFDSIDPTTERTVSDAIDLSSRFSATNPDFYLGSTTWINLTGEITPPSTTDAYRFAGYKGGRVQVSSVLDDRDGSLLRVVIGDADSPGTYRRGEINSDRQSTVALMATNTYTGGTTLESGRLAVATAGALGTGSLSVSSDNIFDFSMQPTLEPWAVDLTLNNTVDLVTSLNVHVAHNLGDSTDTDANFTLAGVISGNGGLHKSGAGTLNLTAANSFSQGVFLSGGTLNVLTDTGTGGGPLGFDAVDGLVANFVSTDPVVHGLFSRNDGSAFFESDASFYDSDATIHLPAGTTLHITPDGHDYAYAGAITGGGGIEISGSGNQALLGTKSFTGPLTLTGTNLYIGDEGFSSETLTVGTGSTLTLINDAYFGSSTFQLNLGSGSVRLAGNGRIKFGNTLGIDTGKVIAPGQSIGTLELEGAVQFAGGGKLEIEVDPTDPEGTADYLIVQSLDFSNASASDPFNLHVAGVDGVPLDDPDPDLAGLGYTWLLVYAYDGITGFEAAAINLTIDSELATFLGDGSYSLFLNDTTLATPLNLSGGLMAATTTDTQLMLSFTPVPEPSTYALFGTGLLMIGWQWRRRRILR